MHPKNIPESNENIVTVCLLLGEYLTKENDFNF